jgi:S1-C subfamily serine protease
MSRRRLCWIAILACIPITSSLAQTAIEAGPLPPAGPAPQPIPGVKAYDFTGMRPKGPTASRLSSTLGRVDTPETPLRTRGARDVQIYRTLVPSVALIVTDEGEGSGSLIVTRPTANGGRSGLLLTSAHVVDTAREVDVVFKPNDGEKATALVGRVVKIDPQHDLALVEIASVPPQAAVIPLASMSEAQVGADVHAIGHPMGQTWTYTKGLISQVRRDYKWLSYEADVIQTQTPINPGNSGGPLISDAGKLLGVNAFKQEGESLNFAVAVDEVEKFLKATQNGAFEPAPAAAKPCKPKVDYEGRNKGNDAYIRRMDMDCTGEVNAVLVIPDDKSHAVEFRMDTNMDGKIDAWILDKDRDGKWDVSYWDTDFDGRPDLIGHHPNGGLKPASVEKYQPPAKP